MPKYTKNQESMLRSQAAMHQGCLDKLNQLLIDGGCEPAAPSIIGNANIVVHGVKARTGSFFSAIGTAIKDGYKNTKDAGKADIERKEVDKQIESQMENVREQLKKTLGA